MSLFEEISHESVRKYYHKLKYILKQPRKKERKLIAVDETIIRVGDKKVWAAIDVETKECLGIWARHQFIVSEFIGFKIL
jgi:transposase-like protein